MIKEEYFDAGLKAYNNKNYSKAIDYFNKLIDTFSNSIGEEKLSETYYMRGICYAQEYSIDEALEDFKKSEELGFNKSKIYCGRGIAYAHNGENDKAIANFNKAIELNDRYEEAYCRRGIAYTFMAESDEAIGDFNKSIELKIDYKKLYYYRGIAFCQKGEYDKALKDFDKIIKLYSDFKLIHINRAFAYYHCHREKKDNKTTKYLNSLNNKNIMYFIIRTFLEEKIKIEDIIDFLLFYREIISEKEDYFKPVIDNCFMAKDENVEKELYKLWIYQYILIDLLSIKNYQNIKELSHYTSRNIFDKLINYDEEKNKAYLRFTSISKANDPKEGEILKNLLSINTEKNIDIKEGNKDYLVFQTSFIRYTNSLTMFRLYGKDKEKEGTGISLVFNNYFFDINELTTISPAQSLENIRNYGYEKKEKGNKKPKLTYGKVYTAIKPRGKLLPLYFMLYYDKDKNELVYNPTNSIYENKLIELNELDNIKFLYSSDIDDIANNIGIIFKKIFDIIKELKSDKELEIAYRLLINIRYLIKHSAFFEEQELRIIKLAKNDDSDVLFDRDINRLYSNYEIPIFEENYLKKVIIGPKIENASSLKEVYQHLIMKNKSNKNINIEISELPLN